MLLYQNQLAQVTYICVGGCGPSGVAIGILFGYGAVDRVSSRAIVFVRIIVGGQYLVGL